MAEEDNHQDSGHIKTLGFNETLMYGQYTRELSKFARQEAERRHRFNVPTDSTKCNTEFDNPSSTGLTTSGVCKSYLFFRLLWDKLIGPVGEDWIFLTLLGVVMALLSFAMDFIIERCHIARLWMFEILSFSVAAQYFAWVLFSMVLVCFSAGFTHLIGPNASGSGIPEMKTIMRGSVLKEYLTFRTLVAKVVGLSAAIGSGLPIGKEGPFVHVASISATVLARLFPSFNSDLQNKSRKTEILAAACAVGVACTFAAPIGGVLFSIEVTATYFAVRNYWRGFYSAVCGALMFRFLPIWFHDEATLTALFKTSLRQDIPFDPMEMVSFSVVGIICGFGGAFFVVVHKNIVLFIRRQKKLVHLLQTNRFIYPSIVTSLVMSLLFPAGFGQFIAGTLPTPDAVNHLFDNVTWSKRQSETFEEDHILKHWRGYCDNIFATLILFIFSRFWMSAIATTLPIPCGIFIPAFAIGAAVGRLSGEVMAIIFPNGIGGDNVVPGGYAIVGAAAFSGSVTHTVSTAVIVFELTGQIGHVLPCVIAVFIANVISKCITVSFYDMLIEIKNLPYLHSNIHSIDSAYTTKAEDFMMRDLKYLTTRMTYGEINSLISACDFGCFPLVDNADSMILLGSIQRYELERLINIQLTEKRKSFPAQFRTEETIKSPRNSADEYLPRCSDQEVDNIESQDGIKQNRFTIHACKLLDDVTAERNLLNDKGWELLRMNQPVCLDSCQVDPAPFQVVAKTSLYKVHSLFSLLSLHHTFVTDGGKLVGIISLTEVRNAVQGQRSNTVPDKLHKPRFGTDDFGKEQIR